MIVKLATNALVKRMSNNMISKGGLNTISHAGIMRGADQVVKGQTKGMFATVGNEKIKEAIKKRTDVLTSHI